MERNEVLKLGGATGKTLLDVGAGRLALIAAGEFDCEVTTIDISASALQSARGQAIRAGLADRIHFDQQDASDLSYPDNSFDIAISYGALHHAPVGRRERFLRELFRVVRESVIIADFTASEFERLHPRGEHEPVDHQWLEDCLRGLGATVRHRGRRMNVYICRKAMDARGARQ